MHTGQATEPHQIEASGSKGADRSRIVADRHVTDGNVEGSAELGCNQAVEAVEFLGVLIRDGPDSKCFSSPARKGRRRQAAEEGKTHDGPTFSW